MGSKQRVSSLSIAANEKMGNKESKCALQDQAEAGIVGLVSTLSDLVVGEIEPSISLTSAVAWALPQPLTRTCLCGLVSG